MKTTMTLAVIALSLAFFPLHVSVTAAEPYVEPSWESCNPVRIFDWDTLRLLQSTKVKAMRIDADTPEKLIAQLERAVRGNKAAEGIRFSFKRELWDVVFTDGTKGKVEVKVHFDLMKEAELLELLLYVSELNGMTFSVKKGEIVFRPQYG